MHTHIYIFLDENDQTFLYRAVHDHKEFHKYEINNRNIWNHIQQTEGGPDLEAVMAYNRFRRDPAELKLEKKV